MERAATTGFLAANELLGGWGVAGEDVWTDTDEGPVPPLRTNTSDRAPLP